MHSHPRLLVLSVVPPVAGLWHQQGDHIVLREAEQGAVVTGCMGEDGLDPSSAVPLQPGSHGAGPGQRTGLRWNRWWILVSTFPQNTVEQKLLKKESQLTLKILNDSIV